MDIACDLVALALVVSALTVALHATRGLTTGGDPDHFRDIAQARTVLDGHPLADPYYRGEWAWYNPLLAWTLAVGSWLFGMSIGAFHAEAGPWLNLLGPIGFYALAVRLAGRQAALAGLALYLFFATGNEHSWASATYSPWLFAGNFAQGLFYLAALALVETDRNPTTGRALASGALVGATFLAHTAPALILAALACVMFPTRWRTLLIVGATAFCVASPFLLPLAFRYRFRVVHPEPIAYVYEPLSRDHLLGTLRQYGLLIGAALAGVWIVRSRFASAWLLIAVAFFAYAVAPTPPLVPSFHFWLYTTAALALLAGSTLAWLCPRPIAFIVVTLCLVAWNWPAYLTRRDLITVRAFSLLQKPEYLAASLRLRELTTPDDIVLGTYGAVYLIIGPAGRKTLAPDTKFSNPYVEFESREADRDRMLKGILAGDLPTVTRIALQRDISAVVSVGPTDCDAAMRLFPVSWRDGDICISLLE